MKKHNNWVLPQLGVVLLFVMGVVLIAAPHVVINIFPPLIGTILIVVGIHSVVLSVFMTKQGREPGLKMVHGFINIVVGFVFIIKQDISLAFLAILFGLYILITSVLDLSEAMQQRGNKKKMIFGLLESLFSFIWGGMLLFAPFTERNLWARFLGVYFVVAAFNGFHWLRQAQKKRPKENEPEE